MKRALHALLIFYTPHYARILVYMLQNTEYRVWPYLQWYWRTHNFTTVVSRRELTLTLPARLLLTALYLGIVFQLAIGMWLIYRGYAQDMVGGIEFGAALVLVYPIVWAHLIVVPLFLGRLLVIAPRERRLIAASERIFREHPGHKIAIAGSYGKTSMKELLTTVLSQGKTVVATPANKNVPISHAYFAQKLTGEEDVLVIEYGEGEPGDVERFAKTTHPTHGVITGLAPAHLDQYKTLEAAGKDIFSLATYLHDTHVYVNGESTSVEPFLKKSFHVYDRTGTMGWTVDNIKVSLEGTRFMLRKHDQVLTLHSGLLGRHHVGPLALAVVLGLELGLTEQQVIEGVKATKPFDHRMQPYRLNGAWIIDDTYNGNIEGIKAGTELLRDLPAQRKIYVTPGLVDQGEENEAVHIRMGELIGAAQPDLVVLMKNSTTSFIQEGLVRAGFQGELQIEPHPLDFYTNLGQFVAVGDVVMMQNDWPDNYA